MRFDAALLEEYRSLLQTTGLQKAYGEFVGMFRWLRAELERQMPDFRFQSAVSGSAVDYACFTFTDEALRQKGLKLAVVFDAAGFRVALRGEPPDRPPLGRGAEGLPAAYPVGGGASRRLAGAPAGAGGPGRRGRRRRGRERGGPAAAGPLRPAVKKQKAGRPPKGPARSLLYIRIQLRCSTG